MSITVASKADYGAAPLGLGVTRALARAVSGIRFEDLSERAVHEGRRGVLDWIGCAIAGSGHRTIDKLLTVLGDITGRADTTVLARGLKLGPTEAALANGQMGHVLDYDDTHMGGVVLHASSPILPALFALAERHPCDGRALICAYAAGFEAGVRAGQAAPGHHDGGWHLTGTLGSIAAGAAAGRLLGLDARQMSCALGIAATQAAGMQQNRGTMCKSFHAGKAASNGLLAALLAQQDFDASDEIIEGKRGFARIYSNVATPEAVLDGLGSRWEIASNGHKPYACGVVLHPILDAMVALGSDHPAVLDDIARLQAIVHPIAVRITGLGDPKTGLQSKFSIYHAAGVAYLDRCAGIAQFGDERAGAADIVTLRARIEVTSDERLRKDEARAVLTLRSGKRFEMHVPHASGTVENPMADAAIEAKFLGNAAPVVGEPRARQIAAMAWQLDSLPDMRDLIKLCA